MVTAKKDAVQGQTTEVATKAANALAMQQQFESDSGAGFEEAGASAYAIPFLQILQSGSPQCKKSDGAYIKGAEEGMFYNTVTQEVYDSEKGVTVIPCHYTQRFNEWKTRESGGGFVGVHLPGEQPATEKDDKGRDVTSSGTTIVDTRNHYILIVGTDGSLSPAVVSLTSTQQRKSKQWMSKMQGIKIKNTAGVFQTAPMMSRKYKLTTVPESNDKGSWFGIQTELVGIVEDPAEYGEANAFRNAVRGGTAAPKYESTSEEGAVDEQF
jgi:hypothetical protein